MKFQNVLTATLVICALITTGLVVYRELIAPPMGPAMQPSRSPVLIENWASQLEKGVRLGPSDAAVHLVEFGDFECPFCASFHKTLKDIRRRYPTKVALYYIHYPLPMHRFADTAARASECAGEQDRFEQMHDILFDQQSRFGSNSWAEFAAEAGLSDLPSFTECMKSKDPVPRITQGIQLGDQLGVRGTPTLLVNGWKLDHPPTSEELERMVNAVLAGKDPISGIEPLD